MGIDRKQYIDQLYYTAFQNPEVSVHTRLQARDFLRQIREGVYEFPPYVEDIAPAPACTKAPETA